MNAKLRIFTLLVIAAILFPAAHNRVSAQYGCGGLFEVETAPFDTEIIRSNGRNLEIPSGGGELFFVQLASGSDGGLSVRVPNAPVTWSVERTRYAVLDEEIEANRRRRTSFITNEAGNYCLSFTPLGGGNYAYQLYLIRIDLSDPLETLIEQTHGWPFTPKFNLIYMLYLSGYEEKALEYALFQLENHPSETTRPYFATDVLDLLLLNNSGSQAQRNDLRISLSEEYYINRGSVLMGITESSLRYFSDPSIAPSVWGVVAADLSGNADLALTLESRLEERIRNEEYPTTRSMLSGFLRLRDGDLQGAKNAVSVALADYPFADDWFGFLANLEHYGRLYPENPLFAEMQSWLMAELGLG